MCWIFSVLFTNSLACTPPVTHVHPQLAGRPVSELCRHLGLTSSALSAAAAAAAATPAAGNASGKKATTAQPRAPNADKPDSRSSCKRPAPNSMVPDSTQRGRVPSPAFCGGARENPYLRASSAAPAVQSGGASSGQRRIGKVGEKRQPSPRPVTLLPRRRIFYSSTFVRSVTQWSSAAMPLNFY